MKTPTLEFIMQSWETDSKIDELEPGKELLRIPLLHSKYNRFLTMHNLATKRTALELARVKKIKWLYYTGKLDKDELKKFGWEPFQFALKSDISIYIEGDADIAELNKKKSYHEESANFCVNVMKEINNRTWQLKEFCAYQRFLGGG